MRGLIYALLQCGAVMCCVLPIVLAIAMLPRP